nr:MAG TPA: hypothetical protein [Caudoviricetes sp.]
MPVFFVYYHCFLRCSGISLQVADGRGTACLGFSPG